jgi:hypothetical protein
VQALAEEVVNLTDSCAPGEGGLKVGGVFFETSLDFSKQPKLEPKTSFDSKKPKLEPKLVSVRNNQNWNRN